MIMYQMVECGIFLAALYVFAIILANYAKYFAEKEAEEFKTRHQADK
jgi:hypothetical protein